MQSSIELPDYICWRTPLSHDVRKQELNTNAEQTVYAATTKVRQMGETKLANEFLKVR